MLYMHVFILKAKEILSVENLENVFKPWIETEYNLQNVPVVLKQVS
jgi:hypothetical protein